MGSNSGRSISKGSYPQLEQANGYRWVQPPPKVQYAPLDFPTSPPTPPPPPPPPKQKQVERTQEKSPPKKVGGFNRLDNYPRPVLRAQPHPPLAPVGFRVSRGCVGFRCQVEGQMRLAGDLSFHLRDYEAPRGAPRRAKIEEVFVGRKEGAIDEGYVR